MANALVSFGGQVNGAGAQDALFLKLFSGEVLTAFTEKCVMQSRHMIRTIENGKSAQFPASWKASASYHTPGNEITGQVINGNERVIIVDDLLISPVFIASIDEAKAHYDFRSEYSKQCGNSLSNTFDRNVQRVSILAARATATVTGGNGGTQIVAATARTDATVLINSIVSALQALDEKDVPKEDRFVLLKPQQYWLLVNSGSKLLSWDLNGGAAGNGGLVSGTVARIGGAEIVMTNHLPQADDSANAAIPTAYRGNFVNTAAVVLHRSVAGTVKLIDLATEMGYDIRRQGTLIVAKYAVGHGILRPESAVEIAVA